MEPKQFLIDIMAGIWNFLQAHDYIYFLFAIIVIVLVAKAIKASIKVIIKIVGVVVVLYLLKVILGM